MSYCAADREQKAVSKPLPVELLDIYQHHRQCLNLNIMICKNCTAIDLAAVTFNKTDGLFRVWCFGSGRIQNDVSIDAHTGSSLNMQSSTDSLQAHGMRNAIDNIMQNCTGKLPKLVRLTFTIWANFPFLCRVMVAQTTGKCKVYWGWASWWEHLVCNHLQFAKEPESWKVCKSCNQTSELCVQVALLETELRGRMCNSTNVILLMQQCLLKIRHNNSCCDS